MCKSLGYGQSKERQVNKVQVAVVVILLNNWTSFRKDIFLSFSFCNFSYGEDVQKDFGPCNFKHQKLIDSSKIQLRSDWFSYHYAICYSPLKAKSAGFENQNNGGLIAFRKLKLSCLNIFDLVVGFDLNNYSSHPHGL